MQRSCHWDTGGKFYAHPRTQCQWRKGVNKSFLLFLIGNFISASKTRNNFVMTRNNFDIAIWIVELVPRPGPGKGPGHNLETPPDTHHAHTPAHFAIAYMAAGFFWRSSVLQRDFIIVWCGVLIHVACCVACRGCAVAVPWWFVLMLVLVRFGLVAWLGLVWFWLCLV